MDSVLNLICHIKYLFFKVYQVLKMHSVVKFQILSHLSVLLQDYEFNEEAGLRGGYCICSVLNRKGRVVLEILPKTFVGM